MGLSLHTLSKKLKAFLSFPRSYIEITAAFIPPIETPYTMSYAISIGSNWSIIIYNTPSSYAPREPPPLSANALHLPSSGRGLKAYSSSANISSSSVRWVVFMANVNFEKPRKEKLIANASISKEDRPTPKILAEACLCTLIRICPQCWHRKRSPPFNGGTLFT